MSDMRVISLSATERVELFCRRRGQQKLPLHARAQRARRMLTQSRIRRSQCGLSKV